MVITRSHINEQISKGGKRMANNKELPKIKPKRKISGHRGRLQQYVKDQKSDTGFKKGSKNPRGKGYVKGGGSKRQEEIRKSHIEVSKKRKTTKDKPSAFGWKVKPPKTIKKTKKKEVITDKTKKSLEEEFGGPRPGLKDVEAKKKKKKTKSGPHMLFGGQKVRIPGKKGGGVITQKVKKYNLGGIVVHDSTKSTKV